jgi:hypothetical protein
MTRKKKEEMVALQFPSRTSFKGVKAFFHSAHPFKEKFAPPPRVTPS